MCDEIEISHASRYNCKNELKKSVIRKIRESGCLAVSRPSFDRITAQLRVTALQFTFVGYLQSEFNDTILFCTSFTYFYRARRQQDLTFLYTSLVNN